MPKWSAAGPLRPSRLAAFTRSRMPSGACRCGGSLASALSISATWCGLSATSVALQASAAATSAASMAGVLMNRGTLSRPMVRFSSPIDAISMPSPNAWLQRTSRSSTGLALTDTTTGVPRRCRSSRRSSITVSGSSR
jgi:hypothetical protein